MAAAAYGAVVSLMHLLENLHHPSRQHLHYDRNQIQTLSENLTFLLGFFEDYSKIVCHTDEAVDLARQIAYAVDEAEEIIDCHVVDQLSQGSAYDVDTGLSSFRDDLERVLNRIESDKRALMMVKDQERMAKDRPQARVFLPAAGSTTPPSTGKMNAMVGFDDRLVHIMDQLTGDKSDLQIVSITGMGGIGKTTLAQSVFDSRCIVDRFDLRKWITISQSYSIKEVLISLVGGSDNQILAELGGELHKMLYGRRYLIVMDDLWGTEIWDELGRFLPNNRNGSRILVTTRLSKVSVSLGSHKPYLMDFLDEKTSWKLFCIKAFGKEVCPNPELEEIGKEIVECCKGLPLAISTIGGLLGKSNMTRDDWQLVANDVLKSIDNSKEDGNCSNILSLSYKHLPIYLKPCFLYMRIFPEDERISAANLINYWVAEGFVKSKGSLTLKEVALEYLKDIIDRNLILIDGINKYIGDIMTCKVHDLLRDLCIREYEKELFFVISKVGDLLGMDEDVPRYIAISELRKLLKKYRTCFLCNYRKASTRIDLPRVCSSVTKLVSCLVCNVCSILCSNRNRLRLVKVAVAQDDDDGDHGDDGHDDEKYLKPTRLRYLDIHYGKKFESTMLPIIWNVQFLNHWDQQLPTAIWEMPQLRHLRVLYDPQFSRTGRTDYLNLEDLSLLQLETGCWGVEEILKRIPNMRILEIEYRKHSQKFHNFAHLHKLQELRCRKVNLEHMSFPMSLKLLRLDDCDCPWEGMTIIGSLPNLEELILKRTHGGPEWNPIEGEFLRLKTLSIERSDLVQWNAEKYHFPRLEMLKLEDMSYLEEIPSGIGDIDTLRKIEVNYCTESTVQSAKGIIAEQRDCGNEEFELVIDYIF